MKCVGAGKRKANELGSNLIKNMLQIWTRTIDLINLCMHLIPSQVYYLFAKLQQTHFFILYSSFILIITNIFFFIIYSSWSIFSFSKLKKKIKTGTWILQMAVITIKVMINIQLTLTTQVEPSHFCLYLYCSGTSMLMETKVVKA